MPVLGFFQAENGSILRCGEAEASETATVIDVDAALGFEEDVFSAICMVCAAAGAVAESCAGGKRRKKESSRGCKLFASRMCSMAAIFGVCWAGYRTLGGRWLESRDAYDLGGVWPTVVGTRKLARSPD